MSFSSTEWTIPELCVWIVTGSRGAVNSLPPEARKTLRLADLVCPGAYAARDEIISKAQEGAITVTCRNPRHHHPLDPERILLTSDFWRSAELVDAANWMAAPTLGVCVARRLGEARPTNNFDLLVPSAQAKELWAASSSGKLPTYEQAPRYDPTRVPAEFMDWAKDQHRAGTIITASMAEDAMRGAVDSNGERPGGLLRQGAGLSRETIRKWVETLKPEWTAKQGLPPSRIKP